ncbi:MAG: helicase-associated domain-containing protein [Chloroflexota bacterium]
MRTLVSYLNQKRPQELKRFAELWEANLTDRLSNGNTFQLAQEMQSEFLQRRLLEKLNEDDLTLLAFFTTQSTSGLSQEDLLQKFKLNEIGPSLLRLRQLGLLYEDKIKAENSQITTPNLPLIEPPAERRIWDRSYSLSSNDSTTDLKTTLLLPRELTHSLRRLVAEKQASNAITEEGLEISRLPLRQLLERLEPELLESLAPAWGLVGLQGSTSANELAAELILSLSDSALQANVLSQLPEDSQDFFARLKQEGGRTTLLNLRKEFVNLKRLARSLQPLTKHLLVWEAFELGGSVVFIPPEIATPTSTLADRPTLTLQTTTLPINPTVYPPYTLAWDSLTFLNYIGQNEVALTAQQYIPKRHVKKLSSLLWINKRSDEALRFEFLTELYKKLNLYKTELSTGRLQPSLGLDEWLRLDLYEQTRRLFEVWKKTPQLNACINYPSYYNSHAAITQSNEAILGWLSACQPGIWYSFASLLRKVQRENPFFIRSRRELINQFGLAQVEEFGLTWNQVEGEIIRWTLELILEWLGVVMVSLDAQDRMESFTLTDLGAELVGVPGVTRQSLPLNEKPLLVQPNFEIMLFGPRVDLLWILLKFTNLKKLDQVSLYTLDQASVLRGMESGLSATMLLEWLARNNPQPLPQNLVVSVQDWSKGFRRVMVERTILLEVEDPRVLDELLQTKQYAAYFVRRLSPTAAVVKLAEPKNSFFAENSPDESLKLFKNRLKNNGFFAT